MQFSICLILTFSTFIKSETQIESPLQFTGDALPPNDAVKAHDGAVVGVSEAAVHNADGYLVNYDNHGDFLLDVDAASR